MALYVDNVASETVNVSFLIYDPSCTAGDQPWRKVAWYVIAPDRTVVPDIFDANLNEHTAVYSGNRWAYLYAYTASGDKQWEAPGNQWVEVSGGGHFNQCWGDESGSSKWVDFVPLNLGGRATDIVYIGWPSGSGINLTHPTINIDPGEGEFYISGGGFSSGSEVSITYTYTYNGDLTQATSNTPTNGIGNISGTVPVSTLLYAGELAVEATDVHFGQLTVTSTVTVP